MERTRHFTATAYVVNDGATLLHDHTHLDRWLPPGGHVDRGELPHETARREVAEETGLEVELVTDRDDITSPTVTSLPRPRHVQLADVNVFDGEVGHQHIDLIYYARADSREVTPAADEVSADRWRWIPLPSLSTDDRLDADVAEIGRRAIETVEGHLSA